METTEMDDITSISNSHDTNREVWLIEQIKNNANSRVLERETSEAEQQRFVNLITAFAELGELYIIKAEKLNVLPQIKIQHYIDAGKFFNYAIRGSWRESTKFFRVGR